MIINELILILYLKSAHFDNHLPIRVLLHNIDIILHSTYSIDNTQTMRNYL